MNENDPQDDAELGRQIGEELGRRAEHVHRSPFSLAHVQGRAATIRRRRQAIAVVGGLAAAAVLVPVALLAGPASDRADAPPPASQAPDATPPTTGPTDSEPTTAPDRSGQAAGLAWYADGSVHLPDGATVPVPSGTEPDDLALLLDGRIALTTSDEADRVVSVLSPTGDELASYPLSNGLVVNVTGTAAAWVDPDGTPMVLQDGRDEPVPLVAVAGDNPRALALRGEDCTTDAETTKGGGCQVLVNVDDARGDVTSWSSSSHGLADRIGGPRVVLVNDAGTGAAAGRLAEFTELRDDGSCSAVFDQGAVTYGPETCEYGHLTFSPDGGHLLALDDQVDGFAARATYVLDATTLGLVPDTTLEAEAGVTDYAWEDSAHYLAVTLDGDGWRLVRVGVDGEREVLEGPVQTVDEFTPGYVLAVGP